MKKLLENVFLLFGYEYNCNGYVIKYSETESLLIDSGLGLFNAKWGFSIEKPFEELLKAIKTFNITSVILTHAHLDHIGGIASLPDNVRKNFTIICHEQERQFLESPDLRYIDPIMKTPLEKVKINQSVSQSEQLIFGSFKFEVLHTPGHTLGSMSLFERDKKMLFSGDCVFPEGSFGRVDFPGSNPDQMIASLKYLSSLDIDSLFAGHMDPIYSNAKESINDSYQNAQNIIF